MRIPILIAASLGSGCTPAAHEGLPAEAPVRSEPSRAKKITRNERPPEAIRQVLHAGFDAFRPCSDDETTHGSVLVRFAIDASGTVASAEDASAELPRGSALEPADRRQCVIDAFRPLRFPSTAAWTVVEYEIHFLAIRGQPLSATAEVDRGAIAGALGAVSLSDCKTVDGPKGSGHVKVTFAPTGAVERVVADYPPFAGTDAGACIERKFSTVKIPPFAGDTLTIGKSFNLP